MIKHPKQRVAIYTRKSTEEGLEQEFNSLDAQREACEAFITSQRELGWAGIAEHYDDGGLSGGNLDRPALNRLLDHIEARRIDIVVVYKIDRLTRSLSDFSRIVDTFDRHSVSFVSVTQQFNTATSMGRLTLNMLLSFAQFEREVTAERIRDKIAASKRKGMWMGGLVPLGYDAVDRKLVPNTTEAATVRWLFETYVELGSVRELKKAADERGIVSKRRERSKSGQSGGNPLSRGLLYRILSNPIYMGCIRHRENIYQGQHEAIIHATLFQRVGSLLKIKASSRRVQENNGRQHILNGLLFDESGDRLSPSHASKNGKRYRYYISHRLMQTHRRDKDGWRLPAKQIEAIIVSEIVKHLQDATAILGQLGISDRTAHQIDTIAVSGQKLASELEGADQALCQKALAHLIDKITIKPDEINIQTSAKGLAAALGGIKIDWETTESQPVILCIPVVFRRRGVENKIILNKQSGTTGEVDGNLVTLISQAFSYMDQLTSGKAESISDLAKATQSDPTTISRLLPLAYLAPDIVEAILTGQQPVDLTATSLSRASNLPTHWADQRSRLGFV